jgi:hypothetical protein
VLAASLVAAQPTGTVPAKPAAQPRGAVAGQPAAQPPGTVPPQPAAQPGGTVAVQPAGQSPGSDTPPARDITLHGDTLTVRVTDVQVDEILRAIAAPSTAEIKGTVKESRPVTIDFADVPLQDGLGRLLGDQNFVLTYREDGSLRAITLLGTPLEESAEARIVKNAPGSTGTTQPGVVSPSDLLQRSVPIGGKLQELIGQPTATMQQLMDISIHQENAGLRLEAARAGMQAIDAAPDLRASVVRGLRSTDDAALTNLLRNMAQDRANEIVSQMAASKTPEIRTRSMQLLRSLSTPPTPPPTVPPPPVQPPTAPPADTPPNMPTEPDETE